MVVVRSSSSVAVASSSAGGSSYPERETLADASKNCFQNCGMSGLKLMRLGGGKIPWSLPTHFSSALHIVRQLVEYSSLQYGGLD